MTTTTYRATWDDRYQRTRFEFPTDVIVTIGLNVDKITVEGGTMDQRGAALVAALRGLGYGVI